MSSFDDENTSPNSPQSILAKKRPELAKLPRQALQTLQSHFESESTNPAQDCSSTRAEHLSTSNSNTSNSFEDAKLDSSADLPLSIIVSGLSESIDAMKNIARLGSSFGQVICVKFIEPATALMTFLTSESQNRMLDYFSTQKFQLSGSSIEVAAGPHQAVDLEPWLLSAARQGRTRTVAVAFGAEMDEFQVRNMFSQYCEILDVNILGAQAVVETDTLSGAIFAATMLNRPSISCVSIDDTALEANFTKWDHIKQSNAAEASYKSALKSNLAANNHNGLLSECERRPPNEQSWERHNLCNWDEREIDNTKFAVDPENVLHVSNYGPGTTPGDLRAAFEPAVEVDEVVMKNGYAFINFSTRDHAVAGKAFADRQIALIVNGSPIRVRYSPDRAHSTAVLAKNAPICNPQVEPSKNLYVCGLPPQVTQEALGDIFSSFCRIKKIVLKHSNTFKFCFVNTMSIDDATEAMQALDGTLFCGHRLKVRFAKDVYYWKNDLDHESGFGNQHHVSKSWAPENEEEEVEEVVSELEIHATPAQPAPLDVVDSSSAVVGRKKGVGDDDDDTDDVAASAGFCRYGSWINPPSCSIHVTNITNGTTAKDIKKLFQRYCHITSLSLKDRKAKYPRHNIPFQQTARCELYAFVNTPSVEDATHALQLLQGHFLNGASLHLSYAREYSSARHHQSDHSGTWDENVPNSKSSTTPSQQPPNPHPSDMIWIEPNLEDPRLFAQVLADGQYYYGDAEYFENFCAYSGLGASFVPPLEIYGGR